MIFSVKGNQKNKLTVSAAAQACSPKNKLGVQSGRNYRCLSLSRFYNIPTQISNPPENNQCILLRLVEKTTIIC